MAIYKTAHFQVKVESVDRCRQAIKEFVEYVQANESGTRLYLSLQSREEPTEFIHFFIFEDPSAEEIHRRSEAVERFTSILYPELVGDDVNFTDYDLLATSQQL